MTRVLASIQKIDNLEDIISPNGILAENISLATILGWKCVVKKNEFQIGDYCIFFEIDSILPELSQFEFMKDKKYRVRTMKFNRWGVISQGLAMPINVAISEKMNIPYNLQMGICEIGEDVTELIGVTKYEPPEEEMWKKTKSKSNFPSFIPKTDELRCASFPTVLSELYGKPFVITIKMNGGSCTFYYLHETDYFGVCTRNQEIKQDDNNILVQLAEKYDIKESLKSLPYDAAIQCELCGPSNLGDGKGIGLKYNEIYCFNLYNITEQKYMGYNDWIDFCYGENIPHVPILETGKYFNYTLDELESLSIGKYTTGFEREGIVIRSINELYSHTLKNRLSFKCVSKTFLLKEK